MTWQIASLALLALALATGFAWYERTHASAKVLALVATLAALAVLGRMAFAPLPSIKPTTDIVLLSGYVLGGAPGFAVGAIAALVSNFFFGQGPYTPWQMVGWGAVGLSGAALAAVLGRELSRWTLAAVCAAAGIAYLVFMDFSLWVMYSGHSIGELGVYLVRGVPFDIAHAAGNVVFCLAFGPMLVRALSRFRERSQITWRPLPVAGVGAMLVVVVFAVGALAAVAPPADAAAAADRTLSRGVAYLRDAQLPNGGFADSRASRRADEIASGWAVMALAAAGRDPGTSAGRYASRIAARASDVGDMERAILALRATRRSTARLAIRLERRRGRDGSYEQLVNRTAFAVMALKASGRKVPASSVTWLLKQQNDDGGWSVGGRGGQSGVDDTAIVIQALAVAGRAGGAQVARAADWLEGRQGNDGGFPLSPGAPSNAQSTAFAIQGLIAARRDPEKVRRDGSRSPTGYLRTLQAGDGSFRYSRGSGQTPTWVTAQVVAALARKPLPVGPVRRAKASKSTGVQGLLAFTALVRGALL